MDQKEMKDLVGRTAAERYVKSGMKLGLGTGSTAMPAVRRIGELLRDGLISDIKAVPTSFQTTIECEKWGIPLYSLNSKEIGGSLDLAIDGADEVDGSNRCVKGGGGALLIEKIVAYNSARFVVVVDESKTVTRLGDTFAVPVELVTAARVPVERELAALGGVPVLREAVRKAGPVITDNGNLILDVRFPNEVDPVALESAIALIPGVVESGFFTRVRPLVVVAKADGTLEFRE